MEGGGGDMGVCMEGFVEKMMGRVGGFVEIMVVGMWGLVEKIVVRKGGFVEKMVVRMGGFVEKMVVRTGGFVKIWGYVCGSRKKSNSKNANISSSCPSILT